MREVRNRTACFLRGSPITAPVTRPVSAMRLPASESDTESPNLTAVIDVVFFMLIYFLVATRMDQEEREMSTVLPEVSAVQPMTMPPPELVVNVSREGAYVVMGKPLAEEQLAAVLKEAALRNPGKQAVLIRGDAQSSWRAGVRVMGLCNRAGISDYRVAAVEER